jgi:hypothetical protein
LDKRSPVFLIGGLIDPVLDGAIAVNGGSGQVFEKQLQIPHHGVLGVGLWASYLLLMVAAGWDHASWRLIVGTSNSLPHEVKLLSSSHVFNVRDVVEYVSDLGILNSFFLHTCYVDGKNAPDASMQKNLKFVEQALLKQPCLAAP